MRRRPLGLVTTERRRAGHFISTIQRRLAADKLTIWPMDDGRYGLDATFQGASGYSRAELHRDRLAGAGTKHQLRQDFSDGWTIRLGPVSAAEAKAAVDAFVV